MLGAWRHHIDYLLSMLPRTLIVLRFQVSVFRCQPNRWPRASSQIEKETNEHRTSNNVFCLFYKRLSEAIPSFDTCPPPEDSIFDIQRFSGSLLTGCSFIRASPLAASVQSNQKRNYIFVINGVVSYEDLATLKPETRHLKPNTLSLWHTR
jgi:hypothetical protein